MYSYAPPRCHQCQLRSTGIHILGHTVNFYHISTQTPGDLTCLFRNFYRSTHVLPTFHYWCWGTITGTLNTPLHITRSSMMALCYVCGNFCRYYWCSADVVYYRHIRVRAAVCQTESLPSILDHSPAVLRSVYNDGAARSG